jgi:cytidine deaminase
MISEGDRADVAREFADVEPLFHVALGAQARARAPYSRYRVGAAVLTGDGAIHGGCNVESAAYGATLCAERAAIGAAVAAGATEIVACVTVTVDADPASCCGICRQLLSEFGPDVRMVNASSSSDRVRWGTIADWLPGAFNLEGTPGR